MTAEIINLRQVRKQRQKDKKTSDAEENRIRHGLTKAEKALQKGEAEKQIRDIDGHRLDGPEE